MSKDISYYLAMTVITTHLTDSKSQLPGGNNRPSNCSRWNFGQVERYAITDDADSYSQDEPAHDEKRYGANKDELQDTSDCYDGNCGT